MADVAEDWIQATNRGRAASRIVREAEGMGGGEGLGTSRASALDVEQQVRCGAVRCAVVWFCGALMGSAVAAGLVCLMFFCEQEGCMRYYLYYQ